MMDSAYPPKFVKKRNGETVAFDVDKIETAIFRAASSVGRSSRALAEELAGKVVIYLQEHHGERIPNVEEVQDAVEKVLIENGHARTAKAFILYAEQRNLTRSRQAKPGARAARSLRKEATDLALFVRTTDDRILTWDRSRISQALMRETCLPAGAADRIACEVEDIIFHSGVMHVTSDLVRAVVNAKLVENGLEDHYRRHQRLGVPAYDVERILLFRLLENDNVPHNPEVTNMTLAEWTLKQFALSQVFEPDVADAHTCGDIHLHDLGFINRPYCMGQSLEYVKKFGLSCRNAWALAAPAEDADTLLAQMIGFSGVLQNHLAGAIGWDAVNVFVAPFLAGMGDRDIERLARTLVVGLSQANVTRGGRPLFTDLNLYWEIPGHFADVPAIGPGGTPTGRTYAQYAAESQRFLWAMFEVYREGETQGRPFLFPKPLVHMTDRFFQTPGYQKFLCHVSDVAAEMGNTYFVFDRGETAKVSECCRLSFRLERSDLSDASRPWKMRYSALQNVTLNLPRAAYIANHDDERLFAHLRHVAELAAKAHVSKRNFIGKLLALRDDGPLSFLGMDRDGEPYLRMHRATLLVGVLGLNELVQYHTGKELHESEDAFRFGLKVMAFLNLECRRLSEKHGMRFVLEQTPAASAATRLAQLDLTHHRRNAMLVVKGSTNDGAVYYTNSTYLNVGHPMDPIDKVYREGKFHDMIEAGALTHIWLADARPPKESIADMVVKTFRNTRNAQVAFSPEFTTCNRCFKTARGLAEACPYCGSAEIDFITRGTDYLSRVSGWNKGKRAELADRYKGHPGWSSAL